MTAATLSVMDRGERQDALRPLFEHAARRFRSHIKSDYPGASQRDIARASHLSQYSVNLLKNFERHPHRGLGIDLLLRVGAFLGITLDELLGVPHLAAHSASLEERVATMEAYLSQTNTLQKRKRP